jgi:hypothetical protein
VSGDAADNLRRRFAELAPPSLAALGGMLDEETGLFSHKAHVEGDGYRNSGANPLYTAMSLAGILRYQGETAEGVFPVRTILDALHRSAPDGGASLQGLVVWVSILAGDARGEEVAAGLIGLRELDRLDSATLGNALHGLAQAAETYPRLRDGAAAAAEQIAEELFRRFAPRADLFRPVRRASGVRSAVGRLMTSFASQVYPLHGLASYARLVGGPDPRLGRVAARLVDVQGELGQWWWLYSSESRRIVEGYPVYSVHQDGMAFMALSPLEELGVGDYRDALALGLDWLWSNELGTSMVSASPPFICRAIQRRGSDPDAPYGIVPSNYVAAAARSLAPALTSDRHQVDPENLEVLRECRSYHLGWLLYAATLGPRLGR